MSTNDKPLILVADDEPSTLALVSNHLRGRGYRVIEATDGDEAWGLACRELPDLVVLDVMMPGMSGWEVCRKIREAVSLAHTGVVMLTGIGDTLNELTSPLYGADAYLDKPFQFTKLQELVEDTLKTREGGNLGRPEHTAGPATRLWKTSISGGANEESEESAPRSRKTKRAENKAAKPAPEKPASPVKKKASPSEKLTLVGAKNKALEIVKQILPAKPPVKAKAKAELEPAAPSKKAPAKKAPAKKPVLKKPANKAPAKKPVLKKPPAKKPVLKKAAKKPPAKKPVLKKPANKAPAQKSVVTKPPTKKAPAKKAPTTRPAAKKAARKSSKKR